MKYYENLKGRFDWWLHYHNDPPSYFGGDKERYFTTKLEATNSGSVAKLTFLMNKDLNMTGATHGGFLSVASKKGHDHCPKAGEYENFQLGDIAYHDLVDHAVSILAVLEPGALDTDWMDERYQHNNEFEGDKEDYEIFAPEDK